jgi:2-phospho-L-lactate transferase/gluconeogenesis factor (CofD/UPF0052 family)
VFVVLHQERAQSCWLATHDSLTQTQLRQLTQTQCVSPAGPLRKLTTHVAHVLPVSDDGGSTAEIVRVIGGPAVGDIRSRCLRLADDRDEEVRRCIITV